MSSAARIQGIRRRGDLVEESEATGLEPLAIRIRKGDRGAERELMELYGRRVFAIVLARLLDPVLAEDLTQETMMAALGALRDGKLRAPEKLPAFLRGTARNLCNNHLRGLSRKVVEIQIDPASPDPDPEIRFRHRELLALVGKCLAELERTDQQILLWSLVDKLSSEEVGRRLGMRPDTVRQHKHRALQKIRSRSKSLSQNPRTDHKEPGGSK